MSLNIGNIREESEMALTTNDIVYGGTAERELKLDTYAPQEGGSAARTAIVLIHGGGWMTGARGMMAPLASALTEKGFVVVAPEYRLVPESPWPAQIDDIVSAVRWVSENADKLGVAKDRIVLAGGSAGGHLALLATARLRGEVPVAAVLSLFAASALSTDERPAKGLFNGTMLVGPAPAAEALSAANPIDQISADFPPVFLLHGTADWLIDPLASVNLYNKLVELGVTAELHLVAKANHEFIGEPSMMKPMVAEIALFLDRIVLDPQRYVDEAMETNLFAKGPEAFRAMMAQMAKGGGKPG
ncbi:hypothetical protein NSU_3443 [Novosphingobium pentaromativorans US6-1]|uniref:BD-FAE-like domain-containing protein n=2 Tax=Novosphingobium pentaromativorans TaxID=205844 RepID=G6EGL3_9SPHN|nr:hypothetical protein NSU_3443 [Novosphingobium pentaromativorans US6-1]